jgi:predicted porin
VNYFNSIKGGQPATQEDLAGLTKNAYSFDIEASYGSMHLLAQYARFAEVLDEVDKSINHGKRTAYSLEGDYWFYPWLVGVLRYEYLKDNYNGKMEKLIPAIAVMLRPNAKIGLEYVKVEHKKGISDYTAPSSIQLFTQVGF